MANVRDVQGNLYKWIAITGSLPQGFEDISGVAVPEDLKDMDIKFLECVDVDEVAEELDEDGNVVVEFVAAHRVIQKKSTADKDRRVETLDKLRQLRDPMLSEADIEINKRFDADEDISAWKTYRQALRDVTSTYIKTDGDPKVSVDNIDLETFVWPTKPQG